MRTSSTLAAAIVVAICGAAQGAIVATTVHDHGALGAPGAAGQLIVAGDLLEEIGVMAVDNGPVAWHGANPLESNRLPSLTDGAGPASGVAGLLNDFPDPGTPRNVITYTLAGPRTIGEIRIVAGNYNNVDGGDGRIFLSALIEASTNGVDFAPIGGFVPGLGTNAAGFYMSDPSGAINTPNGSPVQISGEFFNPYEETALVINDDAGAALAAGVTHVRFSLFSADNTQGQNRDPFNGVNPYTGIDDQLTAPNSSPLVWEIDLLEGTAPQPMPDLNMDGKVDIFDVAIVSNNWANSGAPGTVTGDANKDGVVDIFDVALISNNWNPGGGESAAAVPEPSACALSLLSAAALAAMLRRRTAIVTKNR